MNIGNKIKALRKSRGITQEQLAEAIGISFQAVSKWENNIALPDITLVPLIANYFGVTMDELFDFSLAEMENEVKKIVDDAYKYREIDPEKSRGILEEGLRKYPENDILLNNLLYVIIDPDETIEMASKLAEKTRFDEVKYDALRFLAYAYKKKGDLKSAESAIEQIPEIYFTKLTEMAYLLEGEPKFRAAEKQKWISFENLLQMMWKIAECYEDKGETERAIEETEKALSLIPILGHPNFEIYTDYFTEQIERLKNK
ncbi:MAG: helix-turn-helix domain-containing protein [Ruminococcaceae bacterium]|nr:helix-turn-helix domain-containing protein [Oscillospiraceae bacterium]